MYFNFFQFFSLWLTCRAKQFSSDNVGGTDGDNKGARGDAEGVQKLPKKPEKVQKKAQTNQWCYLLMSKELLSPIHKRCKKGTKMRHVNTQIIYFFVVVTICAHKVFIVSCITDFKYIVQYGVFDQYVL